MDECVCDLQFVVPLLFCYLKLISLDVLHNFIQVNIVVFLYLIGIWSNLEQISNIMSFHFLVLLKDFAYNLLVHVLIEFFIFVFVLFFTIFEKLFEAEAFYRFIVTL